MLSILNGMMMTSLLAARINSRLTSLEEFEWDEKMSTRMRLAEMALEMAVGQSKPGVISLGAIQQRILAFSRFAQTASAIGLS